jgi:sRNA-binding carbon storage regulator CsrA
MLIVTRKQNESIDIDLKDGVDPNLTLREALSTGPIRFTLAHVGSNRVRVAIIAPPTLRIRRSPAADSADSAAVFAQSGSTSAQRA